MHAFCFISSDPPQIADIQAATGYTISLPHHDIFQLPGDTRIGIDQIRAAIRFLKTPPVDLPVKMVLGTPASRLTTEAQQALLKTLEEPPAYAMIILSTESTETLLPTIYSRCQLIHIPSSRPPSSISPDLISLLTSLETAPIGQRLSLIKPFTTKEKALLFAETAIVHYRERLIAKPSTPLLHNLSWLNEGRKRLLYNAHPALTLEHIVFHLLPTSIAP